jgi:hypothetical protein
LRSPDDYRNPVFNAGLVLPFMAELKHHFGEQQFSFAPQIELNDHRPVGISFKIGDGAPTRQHSETSS